MIIYLNIFFIITVITKLFINFDPSEVRLLLSLNLLNNILKLFILGILLIILYIFLLLRRISEVLLEIQKFVDHIRVNYRD
jgi:hypothetical protein